MTGATDPDEKQPLRPRWAWRFISVPLILGGFLFLLYGPGLFVYQVTVWLQDGRWIKLPAIYLYEPPHVPETPKEIAFYLQNGLLVQPDMKVKLTDRTEILAEINALRKLQRFVPSLPLQPWLSEPRSWRGLHKIVRYILDDLSVPVFFFCCGLALLLGGLGIENELESAPDKRPKGP